MAVLSTEPDVVDLRGYAGDSLTIRVEIQSDPAGFIAGRVWSAQVRSAWDSPAVDAEFTVAADSTGATLTLPAAATAALVGMTLLRATPGPLAIVGGKYVGVWDVQLAPPGGGDPTTTVARGSATFTGDVTRAP